MVIDSTDRERLVSTREELYKMLQHEDLSKASLWVSLNDTPLWMVGQLSWYPVSQYSDTHRLVYANKQDLKNSMTAAEISRQLDLTCEYIFPVKYNLGSS